MHGRVMISTTATTPPSVISASEFRLLSARSQKEFASALERKFNHIEWQDYLEAVCIQTVATHEEGQPTTMLAGDEPNLMTRYLITPLVVESELNMIYGDGGSLKSLICQMLGYFIGHPEKKGLGFEYPEPGRVLYLDYETSEQEVNKRLTAIGEVWGAQTSGNVLYRRCDMSLSDDADNIHQIVIDEKVILVIVDSYGLACGGDAISQDVVRATCIAMRSWETTVLGVSHISAEAARGTHTMPFGSRYWHNYHRWTWLAKSVQLTGRTHVGLYHQKYNVGPYHPPIGLVVKWENNMPQAERDDNAVTDTPEKLQRLQQKDQMTALLSDGPASVEYLAERMDTTSAQVRALGSRYKDSFQKNSESGLWELV